MRRRSLAFRLLGATLAVVVVSLGALFVTTRLLGPQLFDSQVQRIGLRYGWMGGGQAGRGAGGTAMAGQQIEADLNAAFADSLTVALAVALAVGVGAAVVGSTFVAKRLLRPLDDVRTSVRRMAAGHYDDPVAEPPYVELADLARDVNALGATLASSEQRRARLVSDLAHELRTPITSLDGFVEGLEDGVFEPDAEILGAMRGETRRLQRLAADLGAVSRAEEHAFDLHLEDADLGSVVAGAASAMRAAFGSAGVSLTVEAMPALPVRADPDRMTQVVTNLLGNALRHTPAGGTVTVTGRREPASARVTVADTGAGIAGPDLDKIFERFYRADSTPRQGGSGIGLTIARAITRDHGGDLTASSDGPGRGAVFTVMLPLRP